MDLPLYAHTKPEVKEQIIINYLKGYSTEDIWIITDIDWEIIDNVIDCYNYLYN